MKFSVGKDKGKKELLSDTSGLPAELACGPSPFEIYLGRLSVSRVLLQDPDYNEADGPSPLDLPWPVIEALATDIIGSSGQLRGASGAASEATVVANSLGWYKPIAIAAYENRDFEIRGKRLEKWFDSKVLQCENTWNLESPWRTRLTKIRGRMMSTPRGLFGTAPGSAAPGDLICILGGTGRPVVLRPKGKHYQLIGACFVDGLMNGEILKWIVEKRLRMQPISLC